LLSINQPHKTNQQCFQGLWTFLQLEFPKLMNLMNSNWTGAVLLAMSWADAKDQ